MLKNVKLISIPIINKLLILYLSTKSLILSNLIPKGLIFICRKLGFKMFSGSSVKEWLWASARIGARMGGRMRRARGFLGLGLFVRVFRKVVCKVI